MIASHRFRASIAAAFALAAQAASSQALPVGVHFGMSAAELRAAVPNAERVARPQRLAGGLSGQWQLAPQVVAGLPFDATFFLAHDQLRRVEYAAAAHDAPDHGAAAYAELLAWGRAAMGPEVVAHDPGGEMASWVQGDTDVYLQRVDDPRRASVRLVYKLRQLKDAREL